MVAKKKFLQENGEQVWHITRTECVYNQDGNSLLTESIEYWNKSIPFNDEYTTDCNQWFDNGYIKTNTSTMNLPYHCTGTASCWGVLLFLAENKENGTGTQTFYPIDGPYAGRVFTRAILNKRPRGEWNLMIYEQDLNDRLNGITMIKMTEAEYNALTEKDPNTLYLVIKGD